MLSVVTGVTQGSFAIITRRLYRPVRRNEEEAPPLTSAGSVDLFANIVDWTDSVALLMSLGFQPSQEMLPSPAQIEAFEDFCQNFDSKNAGIFISE